MKIRPYGDGDREQIIELWKQSDLIVPWNDPHKDIDRKVSHSPDLFFVGTINSKVVASVMAGYDGHRGWINYLAVDPGYRYLGLGRQIMLAAEQALLNLDCPKINLQVREGNAGVVKFYQNCGYELQGLADLGKRLISDEID
jgi:ribosomal protein S18 acetylase RimI-like enzyme